MWKLFSSTSSFEISESLVQKAQASWEPEYLFFFKSLNSFDPYRLPGTYHHVHFGEKTEFKWKILFDSPNKQEWHYPSYWPSWFSCIFCPSHHATLLTLFSEHCSSSIDVIAALTGENRERSGWERNRQGSVCMWGEGIQGSLRTHIATLPPSSFDNKGWELEHCSWCEIQLPPRTEYETWLMSTLPCITLS